MGNGHIQYKQQAGAPYFAQAAAFAANGLRGGRSRGAGDISSLQEPKKITVFSHSGPGTQTKATQDFACGLNARKAAQLGMRREGSTHGVIWRSGIEGTLLIGKILQEFPQLRS
jgi:hypothetical protein